jgi:uncharacterized protein (TIGR03492 family)
LGGGPYGFLGTPKSDYTWRTPSPPGWGPSLLADAYHGCKGSEWDPWEWALMAHRRCRLVAVRDGLTARGLWGQGVRALAPGNPMMDGFGAKPIPACLLLGRRVLLLPGSRMPEALGSFQRLLAALPWPAQCEGLGGLHVLVPIGRGLDDAPAVAELLRRAEFEPVAPPPQCGAQIAWRRGHLQLLLGLGRFACWAPWTEVGMATAGTATEQLVGLGIPALSLPGPGPQFTAGFACRQSRLLGGAVEPCKGPAQLRARLLALLRDQRARDALGRKGRQRMGGPGGSEALARLIDQRFLRSERGGTPSRDDAWECSS